MNHIVCPSCGKKVEISQAITHEIQESILAKSEIKHKEELEKLKSDIEEKAERRIKEELELKFKDSQNELGEEKERKQQLQNELLENKKQLRFLKQKDEERELEMQKKLSQEEEKIRIDAQRKAEEEQRFKILEKEKQLQDALKANEEMRRKLQQGSQQLQGETFELEFENLLKSKYPNDKIVPVKKGSKGGDIIQEIWDGNGNYAGKVLWELKNAKTWSEIWIEKLKIDKRSINADEAILISEIMPNDMKIAGFRKNVWITQINFVIPLCDTIRAKLIQLFYIKSSVKGKDEKMEILFAYLSGSEFKNRVEAIVDAFTNLQAEIEKEKRYFSNKWARDEKNIRQVIDNTYGMHGDLKGIVGQSLPQIKGLDTPPEGQLVLADAEKDKKTKAHI